MELTPSVPAPVAAGQQLGTLRIESGETLLAELPLVAPTPVPRLTWRAMTLRLLDAVCYGR